MAINSLRQRLLPEYMLEDAYAYEDGLLGAAPTPTYADAGQQAPQVMTAPMDQQARLDILKRLQAGEAVDGWGYTPGEWREGENGGAFSPGTFHQDISKTERQGYDLQGNISGSAFNPGAGYRRSKKYVEPLALAAFGTALGYGLLNPGAYGAAAGLGEAAAAGGAGAVGAAEAGAAAAGTGGMTAAESLAFLEANAGMYAPVGGMTAAEAAAAVTAAEAGTGLISAPNQVINVVAKKATPSLLAPALGAGAVAAGAALTPSTPTAPSPQGSLTENITPKAVEAAEAGLPSNSTMDQLKTWAAANPQLAKMAFSGATSLLSTAGGGGGGGGGYKDSGYRPTITRGGWQARATPGVPTGLLNNMRPVNLPGQGQANDGLWRYGLLGPGRG